MGEHVRVSVNLNALEETLEMLAQATHENQRLQAELAAVAERCAPLVRAIEWTLQGKPDWEFPVLRDALLAGALDAGRGDAHDA